MSLIRFTGSSTAWTQCSNICNDPVAEGAYQQCVLLGTMTQTLAEMPKMRHQ